jgi:hypothetical protein
VQHLEALAEPYINKVEALLGQSTTIEALGRGLRDLLLAGQVDYEEVLESAEAGDEVAHYALIATYRRVADQHQQESLPHRVVSYALNALEVTTQAKDKQRRKQGRHKTFGGGLAVTNLGRDLGLVTLVYWIAMDLGLEATRNLETTTHPSAASVVAGLLTRRGRVPITEARLNFLCCRWGPTIRALTLALFTQMLFSSNSRTSLYSSIRRIDVYDSFRIV